MNDTVQYAEKLWPAWWIWLAGLLIGASFSTIFFPIAASYGFIAMGVGVAIVGAALLAITPRIEVTDQWLRVGRAQIERAHLGRVVAHSGAGARAQLGPGFDARSFQCIRGWIDPVVTAEISDDQDPVPYWLFSTRRPQAVLAALGSAEPVRTTGVSVQEG